MLMVKVVFFKLRHFHHPASLMFLVTYIFVLQVYYCKEDEVCLYQSLVFEVPFKEASPENTTQEIKLPFLVKPKSPESSLQLPVAQ